MLFVLASLSWAIPEGDAEPFSVAVADVGAFNPDARRVSEAILGAHADVVVVPECSRSSISEETLATQGYRLLLDARDPSPGGLCVVSRLEGDASVLPPAWAGPCATPFGVVRFSVGSQHLSVLAVHLPSRMPACEATNDGAVSNLAGLVGGGKLVADLGVGRAGDLVVVAGNLNAAGKQLAPLRAAGLAETGEVGGQKLSTWSLGPVRMWLDHVFVPAGWSVLSTSVFDLPGAEHRGLAADFVPGS